MQSLRYLQSFKDEIWRNWTVAATEKASRAEKSNLTRSSLLDNLKNGLMAAPSGSRG